MIRAERAPAPQRYPRLPGEAGTVYDYTKPWATLARYVPGGVVDPTYDYENDGTTDFVKANACHPLVEEGVFGKQDHEFGLNLRAVFSNMQLRAVKGGRFSGIVHLIASGRVGAATGTMSGGGVNAITLGDPGTGYLRQPDIWAYSNNSGTPLRGFKAHAVMEASTIDMLCDGGTACTPGLVLSGPYGIQVTVSTVDGAGGFRTGFISARGTTTDTTAALYGNRCVFTGAATSVYLILDFRLKDIVIDAPGTLGGSTVTIIINPPTIDETDLVGVWTSAGRLGVQGDVNCSIDRWHGISVPLFAHDGNGQSGAHFDFGRGLKVKRIRVDDCKDRAGLAGWCAVPFDGSGVFQRMNSVIDDIDVLKCDVHGIGVNSDVTLLRWRVRSYGCAAAIASTRYFGPLTTKAFGFLGYRGIGDAGIGTCDQNDETIGAVASIHVCIMSTGLDNVTATPPHDDDDKYWAQKSFATNGLTFTSLRLYNASREGALAAVSRDYNDTTRACQVYVGGSVYVQKSAVTALAAGYALVQVNSSQVGDARTIFRYGSMTFVGMTGTTAAGLYTGAATDVAGGAVSHPLHGSGKLADLNGRFDLASIRLDGNSDQGMTNPVVPLITVAGAGVVASRIGILDADCQSAHIVGQLLQFNGVGGGCRIGQLRANQYRNGDTVEFTGVNNKVVVENFELIGVTGGVGNGFKFGGTLNDCHLVNGSATAYDYAFKASDTPPVFNRCTATNVRGFSNITNSTDLANGSFLPLGTTTTGAAGGINL